ncbi:MAG: hypothetical protein WBM53_00780 [Maribacter sp.]
MKLLKRSLLLIPIILAVIILLNYPKLNIILGFAAKNMASNLFIAHRSAVSVKEKDNNVPLIKSANVEVHYNGASATLYG